jgi:hypothetical protein
MASLYKMWYTAIGDDGISICYAESNDGQAWSEPYANPVLAGGDAAWEMTGVGGPCVIIDSMGVYQMWYTGINGTTASIGWAFSPDGITWTKRPGFAPVLTGTFGTWDADSVAFPSVIWDGTLFNMWYTGQDTSQGVGMLYELAIGYAYSDDGLTWTKASDPVLTKTTGSWDDRGVGACSVVKAGSNFIMYYTGFENSGPVAEIGKATCFDGIGLEWTKTDDPVLEGVAAPSFVYIGGTTQMWFTGADDTSPLPIMAIGYAEESPEPVPASSNLSTGLMIGGFAVLMIVAYFGVRRFQLQGR